MSQRLSREDIVVNKVTLLLEEASNVLEANRDYIRPDSDGASELKVAFERLRDIVDALELF